MDADDALALPQPAADMRSAYGPDPNQFGELRLPEGEGPHPVAIVVHGGCWLAEYDLGYISALARALTDNGLATWSIEYRRVGHAGGGWPGTFLDVGAAADHLRVLAPDRQLDLRRVVAVGHSAGGHLALWLAARQGLPENDSVRGSRPLALSGVVSLAGITDLAGFSTVVDCGEAVPDLLGGASERLRDRLRRTSPIEMVPLGVTQLLITGALDDLVPESQARDYITACREAGDDVTLQTVADAGHFELVDPEHACFGGISSALLDLIAEDSS
jgi:acetyl esterase/lipase